jgi:hypothetical protein
MNPSLLLIPDRYKAAKLYSQIPDSGAGDLTFARNSNATRVNSAGLIEKVRENLILQSQTLDNASWTKANSSITANATTAPDNTLTADKLVEDTANTFHLVEQSVSLAIGFVAYSFFAKPSGRTLVNVSRVNGNIADFTHVFNLTAGTATGGGIIEPAANGFFRCSGVISVTIAGSSGVYVALNDGTGITYTGDGTSGVFLWGAQVEVSDFGATDYIPTTTAAVSVGITADIPRLDYTGGGCPSLLLEPQRTNVALYSEQLDNAAWVLDGGSVTANQIASPDGFINADLFNSISTTPGGVYQTRTGLSGGSTYYITGYAKLGTATNVCIVINDTVAFNTVKGESFDSSDGLNTSTWTRIGFFFTAPAGNNINIHIGKHSETGVAAQSLGTFYFWGVQAELGSYPTSYIPTLGSSVTRLAETASKTGISSLIGATEGTIFMDITIPTMTGAGGNLIAMSLFNSGVTVITTIDIYDVGVLFATHVNVTQQGLIQMNGFTAGRHKVAFGYKANDFVLYVDGVLVGTDTSGTVGAQDSVGLQYSTNQFIGQQYVSQSAIYPVRLSNSELASLTSL